MGYSNRDGISSVNFYYSSSLNGLNFDLSFFSFHFSLVPVSFQNRSVCFSSVFIQKKCDQKHDVGYSDKV